MRTCSENYHSWFYHVSVSECMCITFITQCNDKDDIKKMFHFMHVEQLREKLCNWFDGFSFVSWYLISDHVHSSDLHFPIPFVTSFLSEECSHKWDILPQPFLIKLILDVLDFGFTHRGSYSYSEPSSATTGALYVTLNWGTFHKNSAPRGVWTFSPTLLRSMWQLLVWRTYSVLWQILGRFFLTLAEMNTVLRTHVRH